MTHTVRIELADVAAWPNLEAAGSLDFPWPVGASRATSTA